MNYPPRWDNLGGADFSGASGSDDGDGDDDDDDSYDSNDSYVEPMETVPRAELLPVGGRGAPDERKELAGILDPFEATALREYGNEDLAAEWLDVSLEELEKRAAAIGPGGGWDRNAEFFGIATCNGGDALEELGRVLRGGRCVEYRRRERAQPIAATLALEDSLELIVRELSVGSRLERARGVADGDDHGSRG